MMSMLLDLIALVLLGGVAAHSAILHVRLQRLRNALEEAGQILPTLDASVMKMTEVATTFASQLRTDLELVDARLTASRRIADELAAANRLAGESAAQLERLLRQNKKLETARAAAIPRELAEPKGFAQRAGLPPVAAALADVDVGAS